MVDFADRRQQMVVDQIAARSVRDPDVLAAMGTVRREAFVPPDIRKLAYADTPLPFSPNWPTKSMRLNVSPN